MIEERVYFSRDNDVTEGNGCTEEEERNKVGVGVREGVGKFAVGQKGRRNGGVSGY